MRLTFNSGDQRVAIVPVHPKTHAPCLVSGATVSIVDLRHPETSDAHVVLSETSVSQDAFSATLTGASGYSQSDPQTLQLDASDVIVGRRYLLQGSEGNEVVKLQGVPFGGASAQSETPLQWNYVAGDELLGLELAATFPSIEADDVENVKDAGGPYLVTWRYSVDGETVVMPLELWLDRWSTQAPIDAAWVLQGAPDFAARGRGNIEPAIGCAWDDWQAACEAAGRDPSELPPSIGLRVGLRKLALSYLHRWASGGEDDNDRARDLELEALNLFDQVLIGAAPSGQVELTRDSVSHVPEPKGSLFKLT